MKLYISCTCAVHIPSIQTATMFAGPLSSIILIIKSAMNLASLVFPDVLIAVTYIAPAGVARSAFTIGRDWIEVQPSEMIMAAVCCSNLAVIH